MASSVESSVNKKLEREFSNTESEYMRVFLRIRPFTEDELQNENNRHCLVIGNSETVLLRPPIDNKNAKESRIHQSFTFSRIYGSDYGQKEFFEGAVLPVVVDSLRGETCLVFSYGATNSGKTYTIQGTASEPGIIPRALAVIFKNVQTNFDNDTTRNEEMACIAFHDGSLCSVEDYPEPPQNKTLESNSSQEPFESSDDVLDSQQVRELLSESVTEECNNIISVWVSFAEIYNENIYDLLEPSSTMQHKRRNLKLAIDRSSDRTVVGNHIKGLHYVWVNSVSEACRILKIGKTNLHFASNKLNRQSSRSHCIFTVHMIRSGAGDNVIVNSLTFCDLAGLERVTKTQNTGPRLKEAGNINTSLLVLGRCMEALREKRIVPYRDSKLTRLFQGFFTENGKATMIVNVGQSSEMFADTLHVLKFSAAAQQVVSIDNLERSRIIFPDLSTNSGRITDLWPLARQRWSEFVKDRMPSQSSIPEDVLEESSVADVSTRLELDDAQKLVDYIWELEKKNDVLRKEKEALEMEIRNELCREFGNMMEKMDAQRKEQLRSTKENYEEMMERRLSYQRKALVKEYGELDSTMEVQDSTIEEQSDLLKDETLDDAGVTAEDKPAQEMEADIWSLAEKAESAVAALQKRCLDLQIKTSTEKQRLQQLVSDNSTAKMEEENATLQKRCSDLKEENEDLLQKASKVAKYETEVMTLKAKVEELEQQVESMRVPTNARVTRKRAAGIENVAPKKSKQAADSTDQKFMTESLGHNTRRK